jgi:hypothetical protein
MKYIQNLKSKDSQDYDQKPQRNCMFMVPACFGDSAYIDDNGSFLKYFPAVNDTQSRRLFVSTMWYPATPRIVDSDESIFDHNISANFKPGVCI